MISSLQRLLTGKLAKASGLMFISTVGGGILGYAFHMLMGRLLSVSDYGLFVTLMALLAVVGVPLATLGMVVSRRASEYQAKNKPERLAAMFWWVNRNLVRIATFVVLGALPFTPFLRDYLHLGSMVPAWIFLLMTFTVLFAPVNIAFLQAQQNFRWIALHGVSAQCFKMFFCVAMVYAGFKLNGALVGMVLASIATWLMTYLPLISTVSWPMDADQPEDHLSFKSAIPVLIANLSFVLITQLDMLLVNHYFDTQKAGIYAAAAILGKAVMYLPGAIAIAMFPMVAENESNGRGSATLVINAMVLTAGLSGAGALFYYYFSSGVITLFYGAKYEGAAELLRYYGFAMLPMTLVLVAEHFLIAKGRVIFAYVMMLALPFVLVAAQVYHDHPINMVYILAACGWGLVLGGGGAIGAQYWRGRH